MVVKMNFWTTVMESFFIELIKAYKHLWDAQSPLYFKKTEKQCTYKEIGLLMAEKWPECASMFTHERLVAKLKNLRTYYKKERKKAMLDGILPKWEHFSQLQFLDGDEKFIPTLSQQNALIQENSFILNNETQGESSKDTCDADPGIEQIMIEPVPSPSHSTSLITTNGRKRKQTSEYDVLPSIQMFLEAATKSLQTLNAETNSNNADIIFGKSIGLTLSEIPNGEKKDKIKLKIHKMLFKLKYEK